MKNVLKATILLLASTQVMAAEHVNLSTLLSRGEDFNEKEVFVSGCVCNREELRDGLFLTLADCKDANLDNAIEVLSLTTTDR